MAEESFVNVTDEELRRYWNRVLMRSTVYFFWKFKGPEDAEVKKVLQDIETLMDDASMEDTLIEDAHKYFDPPDELDDAQNHLEALDEHPDELENA